MLHVVMCQQCGMGMISPRPDSAWFDQFYRKDYWPVYLGSRFKDLDDMYIQDQCAERSRQIFEAIDVNFRYSPRNYLDVGCGQGAMLVEFRRRCPTAPCLGVEPSPDAAAFCFRRHGLEVEPRPWNSLQREELRGPFDLITLVHVLEHVLDPVDVLTRAVDRLSPNGLIYVEVPDLLSERWSGKDFFHIAHVWYFHETALRNLFLRCGLEVIDVIHGAADIWSWAIGFVGQKSLRGPQPPEGVPLAPSDFEDRLRDHLSLRGIALAMRDQPLQKRLAQLLSPRRPFRFLGKLFVLGREASGPLAAGRPRRAPSWTNGGLRVLAHKSTKARPEQLCRLNEPLAQNEKTFRNSDPASRWLYVNRAERMDALDTRGIFAPDRQVFHRARYEFALDYLAQLEVADIACGLGYGCRILKEGGAKAVVGIDSSPEAVAYARANHQPAGVRFEVADGTKTPLSESSVDIITSFETIEHVLNTEGLLTEFTRILKPEGRLIVSSPNDWGLTEHHCHTWTPFEFMAEITAFFEIESAWEQNSRTTNHENFSSPLDIKVWSAETEDQAECLIIVARKKSV